jgi:hypothetical protein
MDWDNMLPKEIQNWKDKIEKKLKEIKYLPHRFNEHSISKTIIKSYTNNEITKEECINELKLFYNNEPKKYTLKEIANKIEQSSSRNIGFSRQAERHISYFIKDLIASVGRLSEDNND